MEEDVFYKRFLERILEKSSRTQLSSDCSLSAHLILAVLHEVTAVHGLS